MIVCPNCNHPNPDGAVQCEACYTPLPATSFCPSCGATVQADAAFCGQCGYNLHSNTAATVATAVAPTVAPDMPVEIPPLAAPDPMLELLQPDPLGLGTPGGSNLPPTAVAAPSTPPAPPVAPPPIPAQPAVPPIPAPEAQPPAPPVAAPPPIPAPPVAAPAPIPAQPAVPPVPAPVATPPAPPVTPAPVVVAEVTPPAPPSEPTPIVVTEESLTTPPVPVAPPIAEAASPAPTTASRTQLQQVVARLFHVQSNRELELPQSLSVIHIGKPNDRIPPDIDVSGFPHSEVVSRIHADIRIEGDSYFIEDVGSSNGTYINNLPLLPGNRHRLRPGDRISLGKGDLVTFLFQMS